MVAHVPNSTRRVSPCNANKRLGWAVVVGIAAATAASASPGQVVHQQKLSSLHGDFTGVLDDDDQFGYAISAIGDVDGDGISDLAVGASFDDDGGANRGAVWVLFLNENGAVKTHQKISATQGDFSGLLDDGDAFGSALCSPGDLDGDGVPDLVVGAMNDDDGGTDFGALWVLYLNADGTVKFHRKISASAGGFTGDLGFFDNFGNAVAAVGDLDGDGIPDLAVGAWNDDDGGTNRGAVWVLFLTAEGSVRSTQKISGTHGNFAQPLVNFDNFGTSVCGTGDLDLDGVPDIAVGATGDDDGGAVRGAVWILFLNADGTVKSHQKISNTQGGFGGLLENSDWFGISIAALGDLDNDGIGDLLVGAYGDDDGGSAFGAAYVLFMNGDGTVHNFQKISALAGNFSGPLRAGDRFGNAAALVGDLDGDGMPEVAIGAYFDDDGGPSRGAVWLLGLESVVINPDSDGDGLLDVDETGVYGTDPSNPDTDGDGLTDGDEVLVYGTDPLNADTDSGGVGDGQEVLVDATDPLDPMDDVIDSDGDGLLDGFERELANGGDCPDPFNPDSDGDGLSDGDEYYMWGTSLCDPDTDGDGIQDGDDPDPLNPESSPDVSPELLATMIRETAAKMASLSPKRIDTKNMKSAMERIRTMTQALENAANSVDAGRYDAAKSKLTEVYQKVDGVRCPTDWVLASPEKEVLSSEIAEELALLEQLRDPHHGHCGGHHHACGRGHQCGHGGKHGGHIYRKSNRCGKSY
jgi:hypothetical protein